MALKEKQPVNDDKQGVTQPDVTPNEEIIGPSISNIESSSAASINAVDAESSDSDESLDDLMSCGPLKKKVKLTGWPFLMDHVLFKWLFIYCKD